MQETTTISELLERACPSIKYRIRWEILNESRSTPLMREIQKQILDDEIVKEVISWQQPDGWLAWNFHSYQSMELGIRLLCEKGVDSSHPVLSNGLQALSRETNRLDRGIGKVGRILDTTGLGGPLTIGATIFA